MRLIINVCHCYFC